MTSPVNIPRPNYVAFSPTTSPIQSLTHARHRDSHALDPIRQPKILHPIENEHLRLLILENISPEAVQTFQAQGFHVDHYTKAFSEEELVEKIGQYHAIGIRSKTKITKRVLSAASRVRRRRRRQRFSHPITLLLYFVAFSHWMFLYRYESSRSESGCPSRYPRFQLPILKFSFRC